MSDTPRTDEEVVTPAGHEGSYVWSEFARQLEKELNATTAELERTKAELAKEKEDFWKAVANAGPCGACAEIIACGSTMHEHKGCAVSELERTREQLRVARENLDEILKEMDFGNYMHAEKVVRRALKHLAQSNPDKEEPNVSP